MFVRLLIYFVILLVDHIIFMIGALGVSYRHVQRVVGILSFFYSVLLNLNFYNFIKLYLDKIRLD